MADATRPTRPGGKADRAGILAAYAKGMRVKEIAADFGHAPETVSRIVGDAPAKYRAQRAAVIAEQPVVRGRSYLRYRGTDIGSMAMLVNGLTRRELEWLSQNTPPGGSVAELICALIKDAANESVS